MVEQLHDVQADLVKARSLQNRVLVTVFLLALARVVLAYVR
jgi:hypothetical protein